VKGGLGVAGRVRRTVDVAEGRLARLYADALRLQRSSTRIAGLPTALGGPGVDVDAWTREGEARHASFRLEAAPVEGRVAVICSSHRPQDIKNIVSSMSRQTHADLELILVLHGEQWKRTEAEAHLEPLHRSLQRLQVLSASSSLTLGECLNRALKSTDARFVAKFDSDDRYGAEYLVDALRCHAVADAGIVGKHSYYSHLVANDNFILRFPGHEYTYTSTMSGGTFVIDRDVVDDQGFAALSVGEDRDFIRRCHRRGISTYSSDRFNYTVVRSGTNTWEIDDEKFTAGALQYGVDWDPAQIDR
jgi:cellulose synthase/poly-beta-1,6-N-acetylglucosamine synthase-like glycosyltransferase